MKVKLNKDQLNTAKVSFACRRVNLQQAASLLREPYVPAVGDVVLASIEELGHHRRVELVDGRRAFIAPGDLVVLAYGNRYAPDQFEGLVPDNLANCAMVAAGGMAAMATAQHDRMRDATQIKPLGVLADENGRALNLSEYSLPKVRSDKPWPPIFVACGTSMNSGKTHTACSLVRGLTAMGCNVGAVKLTGTGAGGDLWRMRDSGARHILDFTDAGMPSTYLVHPQTLIERSQLLLETLVAKGVDVIVAEIADGVSHPETCALLQSQLIRSRADGVFFAAVDALGGYAGSNWLQEQKLPVLGISGTVTRSPLAIRELKTLVSIDVITADELASPVDLQALLPRGLFKPRAVAPLPAAVTPPTKFMLMPHAGQTCDQWA